MDITPKDLTIGQLFANYNEQFIVPSYQRRYAWKHNQYAALYDDIHKLEMSDKHLLGTILFNSGFHKGGLNTPEIVDGQQRITTLSLLLLAIKSRYEELGDVKKKEELEKFLISKDYDEKIQNKVILGDLDNPDYDRVLKNYDTKQIVNKNIENAYMYFLDTLRNDYNESELNKFYYKLSNNCIIIRLDINDAKNVYKLFEIINNRGLRLSSTDIIKNFILGHASQLGEETLSEAKRIWSKIIVNLDNINTDNFLRQFLSSLLKKKVTKSQLISEFKDYYKENVIHSEMVSDFTIEDDDYDIDDENEDYIEDNDNGNGNDSTLKNKQFQDSKKIDIISFLKKIQKSSEIYSHIRNKSFDDININRSLYDLERIQSFPANIFLLDLFSRELHVKDYYKALNLIKSFMIRRNICQYRTGELDSIFARLCRVSSTSLISNMKNDLIDDLPTDKEFINSFQKHQFKGKNKDRAKYVLEQIEYYLTENKNEYIINTNEDVHLEHIMPLKIISRKAVSKYGDWKEYLGADYKDKHKKYVWRIGNLTLLADELNLGASNNPYLKKKDFYKKSSLSLNKSIVENFKHFKFANQEKRGLDLAEIAVNIWKF